VLFGIHPIASDDQRRDRIVPESNGACFLVPSLVSMWGRLVNIVYDYSDLERSCGAVTALRRPPAL
jgi:hypothetical protein